MANRYWVGGTNTWNATAGTKWALTSGGAGGQAVPTSSDDVFFDGNSGVGTCTVEGNFNAVSKSLDCTGYTGGLTYNPTVFDCYGSYTLSAGMSFSIGNSTAIQFKNSSGTAVLTTAGKAWSSSIIRITEGGTLQFAQNMTSIEILRLDAGTLDANNFDISFNGFLTNTSSTRVLNMGSGTWTCTAGSSTSWNIADTTNLTINAGTSTLKFAETLTAKRSFVGGSKTYYNVWFAQHGVGGYFVLTGSNTINELKISPAVDVRFAVGTTQTVSNLDINGDVSNNVLISSYGERVLNTSSSSITIPDYALEIIVEAYGGGGAGGGATNTTGQGGGGAGGQYAIKTIDVSAKIGQTFNYTVGGLKAGTTGTVGAGNDSIFYDTDGTTVLVRAKGGAGGKSDVDGGAGGLGSIVDGIGDIVYRGGNGSDIAGSNSGAGGGGAGSTGHVGDARGPTAGTGTTLNGGNGGAGRTTAGAGNAGSTRGGGGGGAKTTATTDRAGGNGAPGGIYITILGRAVISSSSGTKDLTYTTITKMAATGGAIFNAYTTNGNIDGGGNTGWKFLPDAQAGFLLNMI